MDVVVVGAGIAGASLAFTLAQDGRKVLLLEREWAPPDTFRGELLQPGGLEKLHELGLGDCVNGIDAQPCSGYVVYRPVEGAPVDAPAEQRHSHVPIDYPSWESRHYTKGHKVAKPAQGRSFHHGKFVETLRRAAKAHPNVTVVEGTVTDLVEEDDVIRGVMYKSKETGDQVQRALAPLTFDCSGCFSKLRKRLTEGKPKYESHFVALLLRDFKLPYEGYGYVVLANPAPVLFYQIGTNELRVLVSVRDPLPSVSKGDLKRYLLETVMPQLPEFLATPFGVAAEEPLRSVPCQTMGTAAVRRRGAMCLGDALNMRHPLTGGGMTVALSDVLLVSKLLRDVPDLSDTDAVVAAVRPFYDDRRGTAATINILSLALYDVFCGGSKYPELAPAQLACFDYFPHYGSDCLGLLSGLKPSPVSLVAHFFTVAAFAAYRLLAPFPTPSKLAQSVQVFYAAYKVIKPLMVQDLWQRGHRLYKRGMFDGGEADATTTKPSSTLNDHRPSMTTIVS